MILPNHRVNHGDGEYVRGHVHTNGIECFSMLKTAQGHIHKLSPKLNRYVQEFAGFQYEGTGHAGNRP